tara:strand:- start:346 stop:516 length:171 start_codon:yes stop_codon:yes gene_type:complete
MIKVKKNKVLKKNKIDKIDNFCEECNKYNESVSKNLIIYSFKLCDSCRISKIIFPV